MYTQQPAKEGKKEPAVMSAEKFMFSVISGDSAGINLTLDPQVVFNCPMGTYAGRAHVRPWISFELSVLKPFADKIVVHSTTSEDGIRTAITKWSVGGLHFTDVVTQTHFLTLRSIKRTMHRSSVTREDQTIADTLLLAWTGPYFSKYCGPKKGGGVDNRALVIPILDYSHQGISNVRELLHIKPKDGREVREESVVYHFLATAVEKELQEAEAVKQAASNQAKSGQKNEKMVFGGGGKEVTIMAKNRKGESLAIVIDTSTFTQNDQRLDAMDDAQYGTGHDRVYYVGSGLKLSNNNLVEANKLEAVGKLFVINAFYFLTVIDLSCNKLTTIPDLTQYPIASLYLHDNNISTWEEAQKLAQMKQLQFLTLFGNPIQQGAASVKVYKFNLLCICAHPALVLGSSGRASSPTAHAASPAAVPQPKHTTLKQLDHCVVSPLEMETLEQFFPKIEKRLKRACSPPRAASPPKR